MLYRTTPIKLKLFFRYKVRYEYSYYVLLYSEQSINNAWLLNFKSEKLDRSYPVLIA